MDKGLRAGKAAGTPATLAKQTTEYNHHIYSVLYRVTQIAVDFVKLFARAGRDEVKHALCPAPFNSLWQTPCATWGRHKLPSLNPDYQVCLVTVVPTLLQKEQGRQLVGAFHKQLCRAMIHARCVQLVLNTICHSSAFNNQVQR